MKASQIAMACALTLTTSAGAQNIYLIDQASYVAGLADYAFENFDEGPNDVLPDGTLVFDDFNITHNLLAGASVVSNHLEIGGASNNEDTATVNLVFDRPVEAIGMTLLDIGVMFAAGDDFLAFYTLNDFVGATAGDFGVIEFSEPVTQVTLVPAFSFSMWIDLDNLVIVYAATDCAADTNGDGMLTPADFTAWIAAFNAQGDACDQNADGLCTPADFTAWIANYNAGC